ncbi:hypothetical protein, partial [Photorhabdus laumondii]|uniref:hypothetical protein n=1 Tax=Photorhabdus laumondii TaxID=2218628 RepID=UPI00094CB35F
FSGLGLSTIDQIAKIGLSSLQVFYYFEKLFRFTQEDSTNKSILGWAFLLLMVLSKVIYKYILLVC